MAVKADAEPVEGFAFVPIRSRVDGLDGIKCPRRPLKATLMRTSSSPEGGIRWENTVEIRRGLAVTVPANALGDGGRVEHQLEAFRGVVLEVAHDRLDAILRHPNRGDAVDVSLRCAPPGGRRRVQCGPGTGECLAGSRLCHAWRRTAEPEIRSTCGGPSLPEGCDALDVSHQARNAGPPHVSVARWVPDVPDRRQLVADTNQLVPFMRRGR